MNVEIEKILKRIPCHVFFLAILVILIKNMCSQIVEMTGFLPNY